MTARAELPKLSREPHPLLRTRLQLQLASMPREAGHQWCMVPVTRMGCCNVFFTPAAADKGCWGGGGGGGGGGNDRFYCLDVINAVS